MCPSRKGKWDTVREAVGVIATFNQNLRGQSVYVCLGGSDGEPKWDAGWYCIIRGIEDAALVYLGRSENVGRGGGTVR